MVKTVHLVMRSWFVTASVTMTNFYAMRQILMPKMPKSTAKLTNSIAKTCKNGPLSFNAECMGSPFNIMILFTKKVDKLVYKSIETNWSSAQ